MAPLHFLFALAMIAVWGFNFVVVKVGLEGLPPIFFCFARFFLASLPWVFFVKRPQAPFRWLFAYGLIMFALQFSILFIGIRAGVSAGLASILLQVQAFFSILLAILFLGEKLTAWQVVGGLVAFLGIGWVGVNIGGDVTMSGLLLVTAAAALWGGGSIISKKMGKINMAALVVWGSLIAWPPLLAVSLFLEGPEILSAIERLSWTSTCAVFYIAYLSTLFGFGIWNWLISNYPVSKVSPFTLLVPIVGMGSSALVLGEELQYWKLLAGVLVIGGLCLHLLGPRMALKFKEKKAAAE